MQKGQTEQHFGGIHFVILVDHNKTIHQRMPRGFTAHGNLNVLMGKANQNITSNVQDRFEH
eukprot:5372953-Amphidinium_carterae.1